MPRQLPLAHSLATLATLLIASFSARASASRTFVSTTGNDSNTSVNCSATAACRTFTAALTVTNAGGEIVVLNSGGYGPATISQPVVITAIGVDASISVTTSGANGLTINTSGNVTLVGLKLHGEGVGFDGIVVQQIGSLRVSDAVIENFTNAGVDFPVNGELAVSDSTFNDDGQFGVLIDGSSAIVNIESSSFDHDGFAVNIVAGHVTVVDSSVENRTAVAFGAVAGGTMALFNDSAMFNPVALLTAETGSIYFAHCLIANNIES